MTSIWVLLLALSGFILSWYIYYKKRRNEKLVCIVGEDCDKVVHSKYSATLGIPNEVLGMLYYGLVVILSGAIVLGINTIASLPLLTILAVIGGIAALFSAILILIQAFILKEWCEYCLASAAISIFIFIVELLAV